MNIPLYDDIGNFEGFKDRECGEHRTVGEHRAWCHDCTEWCYPTLPCVRCEIVDLRKASLPPNTRNNDHATSIEGAAHVAGRSTNQRMRLLHAFGYADRDDVGFDGLTDEEAAQACGLLGSCYWKRCGELRHQQLIEFTGDARPGAAGTNRKISRITEHGRSVLHTEREAS